MTALLPMTEAWKHISYAADTGQVQLSDQIDFHGRILFRLLVKPVILFHI